MQENKSGHFFSEPSSVIKSRWRHNWKSAQVVSSHLVCDPTIRQPGFDLRRQQWKQKCGLWYVKTAIFCTCGSNNWETVEGYMLRGVWQALNNFIHATVCVIASWAFPGQTKNEGRGT